MRITGKCNLHINIGAANFQYATDKLAAGKSFRRKAISVFLMHSLMAQLEWVMCE